MKTKLLLPAVAALALAACGKKAPPSPTIPPTGPSAPSAHPSGGGGSAPAHPGDMPPAPAVPAGTPFPDGAAPQAAVLSFGVPPTAGQRREMAKLLAATQARMQEGEKERAAAHARQVAEYQASCEAAAAEHEAGRARAEAQAEAARAAEKAAWEKRAEGLRAVLADPKASQADKVNARMGLDARFAPSTPMPPAPIPSAAPPPPAPPCGDPQANQAFDALVYRFRQAVESHDHAQALAVMGKLEELASRTAPAQITAYLTQAEGYVGK